MRGGSHDGEHLDPRAEEPPPETLFAINFDDGESYARTGEQLHDDTGRPRDVSEFDPDGSLTAHARRTFAPLVED